MSPIDDHLHRVREVYRATPDLRVTPWQAQRIFALEPQVCVAVLEALLNEGFLRRTHDGSFVQRAEALKPLAPNSLFRRP